MAENRFDVLLHCCATVRNDQCSGRAVRKKLLLYTYEFVFYIRYRDILNIKRAYLDRSFISTRIEERDNEYDYRAVYVHTANVRSDIRGRRYNYGRSLRWVESANKIQIK